MSCVGLERIFDRRYLLILFSFNLQKLLLLFLSISHSIGLFFLLLQDSSILVSSSFSLTYRLLNFFMDNIELIILMNLLQFFLIFLKLKFRLGLFFRLLFQNFRCSNSGIHLYSFCGLFLIFLREHNINRLFNYSHVLDIVMIELILRLYNIFFNRLICLFLNPIFQPTYCNVNVLDDIFALNVINKDLIL